MFISDPRPSQEEEADEMIWHNNLLEAATTPAVTAPTGFPPPSHNNLNGLDNQWNKYVNLEDFCQTAHTNDSATVHSLHHIRHNPRFDPSSSHLDMHMDMMTSFNTSFDTMSASSPSVGATWSESSPEYETCRQHEGHGNSNNTSSSFNRPSTESHPSNDAQSFSPTSDASWDSSPAPQIQGSYMDLSDTTATTTTTTTSASITSPHSSSSMSAYPGHQQQQQQQVTELSQHGLSDASACLQGTVETDTLFNNASGAPPHQQPLPNFGVVWTSAPSSSQPSIISASSPFVTSHQAQPRWHNLHQYSVSGEPMLNEPRLSSSLSLDNMSEGGMSTIPSSPINPFHDIGAGTGHHSLSLGYDGLPSPTHSSFGVGPSSANGGVSLQHQYQHQQYPSVMLNDSGVPFDNTGGSNFSHHPSSSSGGASGGDVLFRGPIANRTVFDYPPSGPTHFQHDTNVALKTEGPLAVAPNSLWLNSPHHKTPTPHPSPESSPIGANSFFHQNQMPLPLDFGGSNAHFGTSSHINTSQLHPHYVQQQQANNRAQRKSLPHSPPHRGMGGGGSGRPLSPRYNPAVMTTREMLPSHPNSPSMAWAHHQGQGHPHGLPHHHPLIIKPNTIPSHHHQHPHPSLASMSSHSRRQQPFHHGVHPYHNLPSSSSTKRRAQGHQDNVTDHLKRARAEQDELLVKLRNQGKSYKQIRQMGRFTEAESTLRGRYRTLTKSREQRVRRPEWTDKDLRLLEKAVREFAKGPLSVTYSNPSNPSNPSRTSSSSSSSSAGPSSTTTTTTTTPTGEAMSITSLVSTSQGSSPKSSTTSPSSSTQPQEQKPQPSPKGIPTTTTKIPWKQVSHYIFAKGGSYKFGNATVRKRWEELMRDQLARGKDLQKPFYEQRSKRSPYHSLYQSQSVSSSASGFAASDNKRGLGAGAAAAAAGQVQRRQSQQAQQRAGVDDKDWKGHNKVKRESGSAAVQVKNERGGEEGSEDGNLAYSDWLDMSALGDDADENHNGDGTDGDGEYELSDASDSEEEEEEDADSDDDYMEE